MILVLQDSLRKTSAKHLAVAAVEIKKTVLRIQIIANQPAINARPEINVIVMTDVTVTMDALQEIMQNKNRIAQNR